MYHALDMGVGFEAFWEMSPRAIVLLHRELRRGAKAAPSSARPSGGEQRVRLNYIPRF